MDHSYAILVLQQHLLVDYHPTTYDDSHYLKLYMQHPIHHPKSFEFPHSVLKCSKLAPQKSQYAMIYQVSCSLLMEEYILYQISWRLDIVTQRMLLMEELYCRQILSGLTHLHTLLDLYLFEDMGNVVMVNSLAAFLGQEAIASSQRVQAHYIRQIITHACQCYMYQYLSFAIKKKVLEPIPNLPQKGFEWSENKWSTEPGKQ